MTIVTFLIVTSFLGLFFVSTFTQLLKRYRKFSKKLLSDKNQAYYFKLHKIIYTSAASDALLFSATAASQILRIAFFLFVFTNYFKELSPTDYFQITLWSSAELPQLIGLVFTLTLLLILAADLLPRFWIQKATPSATHFSCPISSLFLLVCLPLTYPLFQLVRLISPARKMMPLTDSQLTLKDRLFDFIQDAVDANLLTEHEKQLLSSVLHFRDRIAREVMVPRVTLFCLPLTTKIKDAAMLLEKEGYSRVPVYRNSIDDIVGVLMYKDILLSYMHAESTKLPQLLDNPIESLLKEVLYTPETKKISQLLQEFRKKQVHMAIVVDEYGGTSGLVTIEDILEEIVGEIGDEYDEESALFIPAGKQSWIIDARMNLLDLEEDLGIKIPQDGEYDTLAGYVFFRLGTIPKKGVIIHHDDFELEIIKSSDRSVEKVKITLLQDRVHHTIKAEKHPERDMNNL